jgi:hypothetical protein
MGASFRQLAVKDQYVAPLAVVCMGGYSEPIGGAILCWEKRHLCGILGGNGIMSKPRIVQEQWLDQWAERIDQSGLAVVALPFLEIGRGLGFVVSHILLFVQPLLVTVVDKNSINRYINLLEDPAAVESLIERIERKAKGNG